MKHLYYKKIMYWRVVICLLLLTLNFPMWSQAPQAFKYQAVVRDSGGIPLSSSGVSLKISVIQGAIELPPGIMVYQEIHDTITNPNGLVSLNIGMGLVQYGDFSSIAWGLHDYFIRMEVKLPESLQYTYMGTSQLLSVPYALFARESGGPPTYTWDQLNGTTKSRQNYEAGKMVYVSDRNQMAYYDGNQWVLLVGCPPLSPALAGDDQVDVVGNQVTLSANIPGKGNSGTWSILNTSGNNFNNYGYFSDINSPSAVFTGIPGREYILIWNVATVCESNADSLYIRFCYTLSQANAGTNQIDILDTSTFLQANQPDTGNVGIWTFIGNGGIIADASQFNSAFTGTPGEIYTLTWTINSDCETNSDEVIISFCHTLTDAHAGADQLNINDSVVQLNGNHPGVGNSGQWSIVSGNGGSFETFNDPETIFYGFPGETYILKWSITANCSQLSESTVTINFCPVLVQADAGDDIVQVCNAYTLQGNDPGPGNACLWTILSGSEGSITNPENKNAVIIGIPGETYVISYVISNACGSSTDTVFISFEPLPTLAQAGDDQMNINNSHTMLQANTPSHGIGQWHIISGSGGSLANPADPQTSFYGQPNTSYLLRWTITNFCDIISSDDLTINFCPILNAPDAGVDESNLCGSYVLQGNEPGPGNSCIWTIISGSEGSLENPESKNAIISGIPGESYFLSYTIFNNCETMSDTVIISFEPLPSQANAGLDQINANGTVVMLQANTPVNGSGLWAVVSGVGAQIFDPENPNTTLNGLPGETYILTWTISNACGISDSDTILISFCPSLPQANAGPDELVACRPHLLTANDPQAGNTGTWTIVSGNNGTIDNIHNPTAQFYGMPGTTYQLKWTISNACGSSTDTVVISPEPLPCIALAGPDQIGIENDSTVLQANTPVVGTGEWRILSGINGYFVNINNPTTVFKGQYGQTYQLEWSIRNKCYVNADTVAISFIPGFVCGEIFIDPRDNREYPTVMIGNQCWMTRNMNIGTALYYGQSSFNNGIIEKLCYDYSNINCEQYGGLYTWDEAMNYSLLQGAQGICPDSWHIPTETEWNTLITNLGGTDIAGGKAKEQGFDFWNSPNTGATNNSGLAIRGSGMYSVSFSGLKDYTFIWSSRRSGDNGRMSQLTNTDAKIQIFSGVRTRYHSVRCIKY